MAREKQIRYKASLGLAFNEEKEMEMLGKMAREGWMFYSFENLGYKFKKGEPGDLIYCMDSHSLKGEDREQYFSLFEDAGWTHVCSVGDLMHFFSAPAGTKPIYTDKSTLVEKYRKGRNYVLKGAGVCAAAFLGFLGLERLFTVVWDVEILSFASALATGAFLGMSLALIATGLVMSVKVRKLCK